jgi:hypothetical protein
LSYDTLNLNQICCYIPTSYIFISLPLNDEQYGSELQKFYIISKWETGYYSFLCWILIKNHAYFLFITNMIIKTKAIKKRLGKKLFDEVKVNINCLFEIKKTHLYVSLTLAWWKIPHDVFFFFPDSILSVARSF